MKGQLRTFETISVLFIFFILLGMGLVFYGNAATASIQKETQKNMELRALNAAEQAQNLPELACSTNNIAIEKCFDQIKLDQVQAPIMKARLEPSYFESFGYARITVTQIYPGVNPATWTIYDKPKPKFKTTIAIQIPVTISDAVAKQNKFGILTVNVYE